MPDSKLPVIVSGASGFIGSHLLRALVKKDVHGFALVHQNKSRFDVKISKNFHIIEHNLLHETYDEMIKKFQPGVFYHLAGLNRGTESELNQINVVAVKSLIEAVERHSPKTRIVFMSSAAVYGEGSGRTPLKESSSLEPLSPYGSSKLAAEKLLLEFINRGHLAYIARAFNVVGTGQAESFFLPAFCRKMIAIKKFDHERILEVQSADSVRDFLDVQDLSEGLHILGTSEAIPGAYNFCTGVSNSIREVASQVKLISGETNVKLNYFETPEELKKKSIQVSLGDPRLAERNLGWKPTIKLATTILNVLNEMRSLSQ